MVGPRIIHRAGQHGRNDREFIVGLRPGGGEETREPANLFSPIRFQGPASKSQITFIQIDRSAFMGRHDLGVIAMMRFRAMVGLADPGAQPFRLRELIVGQETYRRPARSPSMMKRTFISELDARLGALYAHLIEQSRGFVPEIEKGFLLKLEPHSAQQRGEVGNKAETTA